MKRCQFCAEEIQDAALVCKHCGRELSGATTPRAAAAPAARPQPEQTLFEGGLHWIVFRRPLVWLLFAVLLTIGGGLNGLSLLFWIIALVDLASRALLRSTTKFVLTNRRLSMHTGVLRKRSLELLLNKVESIAVNEPYIGRLFGYGTLIVGGTGGTKEAFPMVPSPQDFKRTVQDAAHA